MSRIAEPAFSYSIDFNAQVNVVLSKRKRNVILVSLTKKNLPTFSNESRESSTNTLKKK